MQSTTTPSAPAVLANERGQANMLNLMMNMNFMASINRMADLMASGKTMVPQHLQGNTADCFAICLQALQWGMNPFPVAQKTHLVKGVLGYEAQLVNAVVVNSGAIKGRFEYEFFGPWEKVVGKFREVTDKDRGTTYRIPNWSFADEKGCGVYVRAELANGDFREIELLLQQARTRNSTLWADDPKQQLAYLGVKRWARLYTPDVILGVYSVDELEEREINPGFSDSSPDNSSKSATESLAEKARAKRQAMQASANGRVIEGEAEPVSQQEPVPVGDDASHHLPTVDPELEDQLAELMFRLDIAESGIELKKTVSEICALGNQLNDEQKQIANEVYRKNLARLRQEAQQAA